MTLHIVYSLPDLDSRNCDKRIERSLRVESSIVPRHRTYAESYLRHVLPPSEGELAEVEFVEVWRDGSRAEVVYPQE